MKEYIEERALAVAGYIIESNATVRQAARQFGISKSTVHKDITERLMQVNPALAKEARKVLDINKSERHIRGGMATKENMSTSICCTPAREPYPEFDSTHRSSSNSSSRVRPCACRLSPPRILSESCSLRSCSSTIFSSIVPLARIR